MNIALFASAFYPSLGGVEELCRQLAMELVRQGHGVIVLTNRWPRDLPATETLDGVPVYRLPFRLPEGSAKAAINYHLTHYRIEREMLAILRSHKIDLLNVHCISSNAHYAMIAQDALKLPLMVTLHGELTMDANQIFQKSSQAQEILRRSLDRADVITACSGKTLRDAEEFYGKPFGDRGRVIFNGVNLADFAAPAAAEPQVTGYRLQVTEGAGDEVTGDRLQVTGEPEDSRISQIARLASQPAGRGSAAAGKNTECSANTAITACTEDSNSYLLTPSSSARRAYIFALGRMAKQKGFDVLIRAYAALRFNDQRAMSNDQNLEDGGGLATEVTEITETEEGGAALGFNDHGSMITDQKTGDDDGGLATEVTEITELENTERTDNTEYPEPVACNASPVTSALSVPSVCSVATTCLPALVIAGDGPELGNLKDLVGELGLGDRVHFPGRADRRQVAAYLAGCEFFVISSPAEPFGIVILEAMAAGAAVIAVNNAGPAEIITNGVDGLLAERSEPGELAAAMQRLITDVPLRNRLAAAGKARAAEFAWPKIAGQYAEAYVAAAGG